MPENPVSSDLTIELEEYKALREEIIACNQNAHTILNWGFSTTAVLFSAGLGSEAIRNLQWVRVLYFLLLIPIYVTYTFFFWFGEIVRQQRADSFLCELEERINASVPRSATGKRLRWHHDWLRRKTENPLQGLQYAHYRNIALGFLMAILASEALSVWAFFNLNGDREERLLFVLLPAAVYVIITSFFQGQAKHYFRYDLFAIFFSRPWLSLAIVMFRIGVFALLISHVLGWASIPEIGFTIPYLVALTILSDLLDGHLVRLYAPSFAARFRLLDSCVDIAGLSLLILVMMSKAVLPYTLGGLVLLRQAIVSAGALVLLARGRRHGIRVDLWNRLFYVYTAFVVVRYLCSIPVPESVLVGGVVTMFLVSLASYTISSTNPRTWFAKERTPPAG
jgi:hypothetical protein